MIGVPSRMVVRVVGGGFLGFVLCHPPQIVCAALQGPLNVAQRFRVIAEKRPEPVIQQRFNGVGGVMEALGRIFHRTINSRALARWIVGVDRYQGHQSSEAPSNGGGPFGNPPR
jgi:hypothetical protein